MKNKSDYIITFILLLILISTCYSITTNATNTTKVTNTTKTTTNNQKLKIHIIPHSHMDTGWLHTFDEYFNNVKCVRCIFNNMVISLKSNTLRTFVVAEMAFFKLWYEDISDNDKVLVKKLVNNGQLEFVNGGWVMNDEADTLYNNILDQMRIGLNFLYEEFDITPKVAWSIDPFGHSITNVSLYKS